MHVMARHARSLPVGNANTQHISAGVLALCFPMTEIQAILQRCGRASKRVRDLPAEVIVFYVIALSLFPGTGYENVLRWLLAGLQWLDAGTFRVSGKGALSAARQRLGAAPMRQVHEQLATPLANPHLTGSYWKGLHLVAMDGSTIALQDTKANDDVYERSRNQKGTAAYPIARFVALAEVGTHMVFAAELGGYRSSEVRLAEALVHKLKPGMLCLADRLFTGCPLWKKALTSGADLLWRAKVGLQLEWIKDLADGSWLANWYPSRTNKRKEKGVQVRVIEYKLKSDSKPEHSTETYRLLTSILDESKASAQELAQLYPERWEIELSIKEGKTILRHGSITLRSKVAELVEQEFWGLLLAHYLVRKMMAQASMQHGIDPDILSYTGSVEIIKSTQAGPVLSFSP